MVGNALLGMGQYWLQTHIHYEMDNEHEIIDTLCDASNEAGLQSNSWRRIYSAPSDIHRSNSKAREPGPFPTLG